MRIAFVTPVDPAQHGVGTALRAAFWRRTLASIGDVTTLVIPLLGDTPTADEHPELGEFVTIAPLPLDDARFPRLANFAPEYLGARWATEVADFDVIVGLRSYVGLFCIGLGSATYPPIVIDLDDDDAAYYAARGEHQEAQRFRDLVDALRPRVAQLTSAHGATGTTRVPNVVPADATHAAQSSDTSGAARVVMVANLTYEANREGARWLLDTVWPIVSELHPDAELVIAGMGSSDLEHGVGFVDDLGDVYNAATVAVAPLLSGSGTRIKILEAWMRSVPVVATSVGIEGLDARHDEHALVSNEPAGFAQHISNVITDRTLGQRLVAAAGSHVTENFTAEVVAETVRSLIDRVTRVPVGPWRRDDLEVSELDDGLVVDDEAAGMVHHLEAASSVVFTLCDGAATTHDIAGVIADAFSIDTEQAGALVAQALDQLVVTGLVHAGPGPEREQRGDSVAV